MSEIVRTFPRAAFAGIEFPFVDVSVKGSLRHFVHVYFHAPGGEIENLERNLYEIEFTCDFHDVFQKYPNLYPRSLADLRDTFESGETQSLVIPSIGTIEAKCIDWEQRLTAKILSGERTRFKFLEDQRQAFLTQTSASVSPSALKPLAVVFQQACDDAGIDNDIIDQITGLANDVAAIGDQAELFSSLLDAKLTSLVEACVRLDKTSKDLSKPRNWAVADALHELAGSAQQQQRDIQRTGKPVDTYEVPRLMTVSQASIAIFGTTDKAVELLKMNRIEDAFAIPPGAELKHYAKAA